MSSLVSCAATKVGATKRGGGGGEEVMALASAETFRVSGNGKKEVGWEENFRATSRQPGSKQPSKCIRGGARCHYG